MELKSLAAALEDFGLSLRGVAATTPEEQRQYGLSAAHVALVGNLGPAMWPVFSGSPEFKDGQPDPLDRWSRRIADEICARFGLPAVFPFTGPPYLPFQRWARAAEALEASPPGLLMHPQYGLWHAYRFALLLPEIDSVSAPAEPEPICANCSDKPCLNSCPVSAITHAGYDVPACVRYLEKNASAACHQNGCMARFACPQANHYRYEPAQSRFHLQAFLNANSST